jgi:hypothetical protein
MLKNPGRSSTPPRTPWAISGWTGTGGTSIPFPVGDPTAGEVIGADFHKHLVTCQQLDAKLGQFSRCSAQTLVPGWLLEGDKVKPISLLFFNHTRRFDHAETKT